MYTIFYCEMASLSQLRKSAAACLPFSFQPTAHEFSIAANPPVRSGRIHFYIITSRRYIQVHSTHPHSTNKSTTISTPSENASFFVALVKQLSSHVCPHRAVQHRLVDVAAFGSRTRAAVLIPNSPNRRGKQAYRTIQGDLSRRHPVRPGTDPPFQSLLGGSTPRRAGTSRAGQVKNEWAYMYIYFLDAAQRQQQPR